MKSLDKAWSRVEKKRSHKLRNTLIVAGIGGGVAAAAAAAPKLRNRIPGLTTTTTPRTIEESIEVNAPVSTVYNQWTQFEDFPLFMEGVDHVGQLDDTRLKWVSTVAGLTGKYPLPYTLKS